MLKNSVLLKYDTIKYPFTRILEWEVYKTRPLDKLHEKFIKFKRQKGEPPQLTYADNLRLRGMMQNLPDESNFYKLYHAFVANIIGRRFGGKISYSNHPKMRVHLAETPSVSKWHRDADITRRTDQINVWLPFTDTFDTNTLWVESDYGLGDYQPVNVKYGEALLFDGGFLSHGTVENTTGSTRVSLDFRFAVKGTDPSGMEEKILGDRPGDLKLAEQADIKMM